MCSQLGAARASRACYSTIHRSAPGHRSARIKHRMGAADLLFKLQYSSLGSLSLDELQ